MIDQKTITGNLYAFYKAIVGRENYIFEDSSGLEAVFLPDKAWPAYILGNVSPSNPELEKIILKMKLGDLPQFWIRQMDKTDDFDQLAIKSGIRPINKWLGMSLNIDVPFDIDSPSGDLIFERIDSPDKMDSWVQRVNSELMTSRKITTEVFVELLGRREFDFFQLKLGNKVVSTLLMFYQKDVAGIYLVSTEKEFRGRGYGKFITSKAIDYSIKKAYSNFVLHSTGLGEKIYSRLGFKHVCEYGIYWLVGKL
ncbi:MAG: GNAT family N-acetyltransferase [Bacteroidales bacterium]|nr:GNAT family N-acetyltransferase [Bacteroidales bacterium]